MTLVLTVITTQWLGDRAESLYSGFCREWPDARFNG